MHMFDGGLINVDYSVYKWCMQFLWDTVYSLLNEKEEYGLLN